MDGLRLVNKALRKSGALHINRKHAELVPLYEVVDSRQELSLSCDFNKGMVYLEGNEI